MLEDLMDYLARALVDYPERVEVSEKAGETASVIGLKVDRMDLPRVIGEHGSTADAMRTILSCVAGKTRKRAVLEIIE